VKQGKNGLQVN